MLMMKYVLVFVVLGLLATVPSFAETSVESLISKNDHEGLANYYAKQVQELNEKAKHWEFTAEFYEKHANAKTKAESAQHAAHCRGIAQEYKEAAEKAEILVREHREQALPPRTHQ